MKKILTAILAVTVILTTAAGCGRSADGQIMDEVLRDIPNVAETTGYSEIAPGTGLETFTTTEASISERVAATEETEVVFDYDDSMFPVGEWVDVIEEIPEYIYIFYEDGQYEISMQTHSIFGKYKFEDETLTLIMNVGFDIEKYVEFAFDVRREENGYRLYYNSEKSTNADDIVLPPWNPEGQTSEQERISGLSNLFYGFESRESFLLEYYGAEPFTMTKAAASETDSEPRPAQQEDLIGVWTVYDEAIYIFDTDRLTELSYGEKNEGSFTIKDGLMTLVTEDGEQTDDLIFTFYEDKIYITSDEDASSPDMMVRYEHKPLSISDFDGEYYLEGDIEETVTVENGKIESWFENELVGELTVNGEKVTLTYDGESTEYTYYIIEDYIYLLSGDGFILMRKDN